ncbi:hypothetical protein HCG49_13400 [Arenibacter sp. 6A1]|uniref:hypothetical protein n=1 Tax=Arenibacter sp. 6A1 TaxID=2720391 RepID=UPI001447E6F9|nr:hypothetical protein [Arenibacter sp. 6A1]NKI27560.1 hypothetical protein [Arenibacter sp. 6A1]
MNQHNALATTTVNNTNLGLRNYVLPAFFVLKSLAVSQYFKSRFRLNIDNEFIHYNQEYLENIKEYDFAGYTQRDFYEETDCPKCGTKCHTSKECKCRHLGEDQCQK